MRRQRIAYGEFALQFRNGRLERLLGPGRYWVFDPFNQVKMVMGSEKDLFLRSDELEQVAKSGLIDAEAVDGRSEGLRAGPGVG